MTAWHRLTHLIQRIIAYALLGILICTFILPKGITRTSYAPGANSDSNSFVEVDQVAKAGATNDPFLFRQIQISHFSYAYFHIDENSTPASVHSKYFASNRLRKSSSSSRILPKTKSLPDKKRCSTIVLAYDPGDTENLTASRHQVLQALVQQNPENNVYRGPPATNSALKI